MPTHASHRSAGTGTCPHCDQTLLTEQAARQLHETGLETQRKIEAAARALAADLERGPIARADPAPGPEPSLHETEAESATELHDVRLSVRQF